MNKSIVIIIFSFGLMNIHCYSSHKKSEKAQKSNKQIGKSENKQIKKHKNIKNKHKIQRDNEITNKNIKNLKETIIIPSVEEAKKMYPWKRAYNGYLSLAKRIPAPENFKRVKTDKNSYEYWLRNLPLLPAKSPVRDYTGRVLPDSTAAAAAVVDLDLDKHGLQQCMDSIVRLRAEYLWQADKKNKIKFKFEGRLYLGWNDWKNGLRPVKRGRKYILVHKRSQNDSKKNFYKYLDYINVMTGTVSNVKEPKVSVQNLKAGDFFVYTPPSGQFGHAILIMDVAESSDGQKKVMLGEGYTPAQSFHILKNPDGGVWYEVNPTKPVRTPLWYKNFYWSNLRRFKY